MASSTPQKQPQEQDKKPRSLLELSKWYSVVKFVSQLTHDVAIGREAFLARAKANPRDAVAKLFALVWPDRAQPAGRGELFALLALGLGKVYLLSKSANVTRALATAVQAGDRGGLQSAAKKTVLLALLGGLTSAASTWAENSLAIHWRSRVTKAIHDKYFEAMNFYSLGNLTGKQAIVDPEERLSREVFSATKRLARIVSLLLRALPALGFFTWRLWRAKGVKYAAIPLLYYGLAYEVAQRLFPKNIGDLYRFQSSSNGAFSRAVTRVQTHGESIAALGGAEVEKQVVVEKYKNVTKATRFVHLATSAFGIIFKLAYIYIPRAFMAAFVYSPVMGTPVSADVAAEVGEFRQTGQVLLEMLVANGDLLTMAAQAEHMGGTAYRVMSLYETLCQLSAQHGKRQTATFEQGDSIAFENVQVKTPTGVELVKDLSFNVPEGKGKLLLTGQNGAGKSSIFRCLGSLWESQGKITKPEQAAVFYLPQKPYLVEGSLAEQLTYPFPRTTLTDQDMHDLLEQVELLHLAGPDYKSTVNWEEKLSLGEAQRLALARLFFHKPKFAVIDESTSACSQAMEDLLYRRCQELGIAYITICHRPALKQYHDVNLNLLGDGKGGWELKEIDHSQDQTPSSFKAPVRNDRSVRNISVAPSESSVVEQAIALRSLPYAELKKEKAVPYRSALSRILALLRMVLPGSYVKLTLLLGALSLRTLAHQAFSKASGALLGAALTRNSSLFAKALGIHFAVDVGGAIVEESCSWLQNEVGVVWAQNLTRKTLDLYFRDNAFYNARNIDRRIRDPDQRITQEVQELAQGMAGVFASSLTPLFDASYFGYRLHSEVGFSGMLPLLSYAGLASTVLMMASPNHRFLNMKEKELESQYRSSQSRLKVHAESIAFLGGGQFERNIADNKLNALISHLRVKNTAASRFKAVLCCVYEDNESYSTLASIPQIVVSYMQMFQQEFNDTDAAASASSNVYLSATTERLLQAAGKLSNLFESLASVTSSSARVTSMFDVMNQMHMSGQYKGTSSKSDNSDDFKAIEVHHVDIVTPNGICLAKDVNVTVPRGDSICCTGVNSSGKSSFFRVLSGLWPARGADARIVCPPRSRFLLVPQKPYSFDGTLAQQVTYPLISNNSSDDDDRIIRALEMAGIAYLVSRYPDGLRTVMRWEDTLSLGEQQRMGFARMFYHRPLFSVLDECSDAVSMEQEEKLYRTMHELQCTAVTISKRLVLPQFHSTQLHFGDTSQNGWSLQKINQ